MSSTAVPKPPIKAEKIAEAPAGNIVLIGRRPALNYALAIMIQFNRGAKEVLVKARGSLISKAVDAVEMIRRRFFGDRLEIKNVKIGTEVLGEADNPRHVSTIEILLRLAERK